MDPSLEILEHLGLAQATLAEILKPLWLMATGEDFRRKTIEGDRPGWLSKKFQRYFDHVLQLAKVDSFAH